MLANLQLQVSLPIFWSSETNFFVAVNLALAISRHLPQKDIGLLDADIFGPSIPTMMNLKGTPELTKEKRIIPLVNYNIKWYFSVTSLFNTL